MCNQCTNKDKLIVVSKKEIITKYANNNGVLYQADCEDVYEEIYFECPECGEKFNSKGNNTYFYLNLSPSMILEKRDYNFDKTNIKRIESLEDENFEIINKGDN